MDATNYLRDALLDHVLKNTAYTSPTTIYLALYTTATDADSAGTEMTGGTPAYARVAVAWDSAVDGDTESSAAESVNCSGETVVAVALHDHASAGNMLFQENLGTGISTSDGDTLDWAAGELTSTAR